MKIQHPSRVYSAGPAIPPRRVRTPFPSLRRTRPIPSLPISEAAPSQSTEVGPAQNVWPVGGSGEACWNSVFLGAGKQQGYVEGSLGPAGKIGCVRPAPSMTRMGRNPVCDMG